jgi:hypothetical protein
MCPIDVPSAYIQQVSANHHWLTQNFYNLDKAKAEQNQNIIKFVSILFKNINENLYPQALEEIELFSEAEAAKLKSELPPIENVQTILAKVKAELLVVSATVERDFLQTFQIFIENHINFVELLDLYAQPLTAEEEIHIQNIVASNRKNTDQRLEGWDNNLIKREDAY